MLKIIIDNRERSLIELFELNRTIQIEKSNLDIGDIMFIWNENPIVIIERKTLSDLSSSIKDGRYKEQKNRLLNSIDNKVRKMYIIEGVGYHHFALSNGTLDSMIINTQLRDQIYLLRCNNLEETYRYLITIYNNIPKYIGDLENKGVENYLLYKTCKKENISQRICFENMMKQIPGISTKIADFLGDKYGTINNFMKTIGAEENQIKTLSELNYGVRKIGKKTAEKIYYYLFENEKI